MAPLLAVLVVLLLALGAGAEPGTFFVAVDGNDAWSGTLPAPNAAGTDGPFATAARARDAVRAADPAAPRRVLFRAGTHYLAEPLELGPADSGSAERPVVWAAAPGEEATLSGGRLVEGWRRGADGVWTAPLPAELAARQMRVGGEAQRLARHPNFVPDAPTTGGWLFADAPIDIAWATAVGNIHTPGDWIEWDIDIPAAGEYALWLNYGALNQPHGRTTMAGRTAIQVDGGEPTALQGLDDTGGWSEFRWGRVATLTLPEGRHTLRWTNQQGGGINLNALALTDALDATLDGMPPTAPAGARLLIRQAEAYDRAEGREMSTTTGNVPRQDLKLLYKAGDIPDGWDLTGAELLLFPAWSWVGGPVGVTAHEPGERLLRLADTGLGRDIRPGNRFVVRDLRAALDEPGEFYHDRAAGELLYLPVDDTFAQQPVVVPVLGRIVTVRGEGEQPAEHIRFEGLTFRDTTYSLDFPSPYVTPDAAIWLDQANHVTVRDCTFTTLGGYGVHLLNRSAGCRVLGCRVFDVGGGGVLATGDGQSQPIDGVVAGCRMHDLGRVYKHVAGVYITTGSGFTVAHNTITDVPRYAVSFKSYGAANGSHNNTCEFNEMLRTNLETNDTGAIETLGRDRELSGNRIRYNLILDVVGMKHKPEGGLVTPTYTWGVYLDDYSSGTEVVGNIVARTVRGGYHNHLGFQNVVENNVFIDGADYQAEYNGRAEMRDNVFRRNIVVWSNPEAVYLRSSGWDPAVLKACDHNLLHWSGGDVATTDKPITPAGPWAQWLALGFDTHSAIADPGFVDPAADDYRLRPDSPALALGFQPIPVERIGVKGYDPAAWDD